MGFPGFKKLKPFTPYVFFCNIAGTGFFYAIFSVEDTRDLQPGAFVKLEGSWFSHPFPTNTFKIKNPEDLATIQGLKNVTVLYDSERSTSFVIDDIQGENQWSFNHETNASVSKDIETFSDSELNPPEVPEPLIKESFLSEIMVLREKNHEFQNHQRRVEGAYQKTLGQSYELFLQLSDRRLTRINTADGMVTRIVTALHNPKTAMSLINVVGSNGGACGLSEQVLNVCTLSLLIGRQLGLEAEALRELGCAALFHDVGYRALPMKVRFSVAGMKIESDSELEQRYPEVGRQLMASFPDIGPVVLEMIGQHHERLDGSGFPNGMKADDLSLLTIIVMVADHYDELCNAPDSKTSLSPHAALSRLFSHVVVEGENR